MVSNDASRVRNSAADGLNDGHGRIKASQRVARGRRQIRGSFIPPPQQQQQGLLGQKNMEARLWVMNSTVTAREDDASFDLSGKVDMKSGPMGRGGIGKQDNRRTYTS